MNDMTTIEMECDVSRLRISVKLSPEGIAAALDALQTAGEVLRDLFRRRGWVPPEGEDGLPPAKAVKRKGVSS